MGNLTDLVTTINIPLVSAAEYARGDFLTEWAVSDFFSTLGAEVFIRRTVGELLFEGYEDTIMEIGSAFTEEEEEEYDFEEYDEEEYYEEKRDEKDDERRVLDKFGFFYKV